MPAEERKVTEAEPSPFERPIDANNTPESMKQRREQIQVLAYSLAERRGFAGGCELDDWLGAERQIDGGPSMPVQFIDHD